MVHISAGKITAVSLYSWSFSASAPATPPYLESLQVPFLTDTPVVQGDIGIHVRAGAMYVQCLDKIIKYYKEINIYIYTNILPISHTTLVLSLSRSLTTLTFSLFSLSRYSRSITRFLSALALSLSRSLALSLSRSLAL